MKNRIFTLLILLTISPLQIFSQPQIENGNFENWTNNYNAENWNSQMTIGVDFNTAQKTTDCHSGAFAAKLETTSYFAFNIPGMITLGELNLLGLNTTGGIEFSERPIGISFYMKYQPVLDTMMMITYLTKWNEETESADTIGGTLYFNTQTIEQYTKITVPILYRSDINPDTLNVLFLSSLLVGNQGSTLYIDDVVLEYELQNFPTLCLPASNISENQFTANWMQLPNENIISYSIDVAFDEEFINIYNNYDNFEVGNVASFDIELNNAQSIYYYRVKVNYENSQSINSNVIRVDIPLTTTCLDATEITFESFVANWELIENATDYLLDVSENEDFSSFIQNYENYSTDLVDNYMIEGLDENTDYYYRIQVVYNNLVSEYSNVINLTTEEYVDIDNRQNKNQRIYSNKNNIIIYSNIVKNQEVEIFNILGEKIYQSEIYNFFTEITINENGIYFVRINDGQEVQTKKIIISQ